MIRYFVNIAYHGRNYHGWQIQPEAPSIQESIETALFTFLRRKTPIVGCGRTDTGVHASSYWFHFESEEPLEAEQVKFKLNNLLPQDIAVYSVQSVPSDLHARFSAKRRTYHYFIHQRKDPFLVDRSYFFKKPLDLEAMNLAGEWLQSLKDFSSFCKAGGDQQNNLCDLTVAQWTKEGDYRLKFEVTANRFLRNMVRALVGTFIEVGIGKITPEELIAIAEAKDRSNAGYSVPAQGLFLAQVDYEYKQLI